MRLRTSFVDLPYSDSSQDWETSAGQLSDFVMTTEDVFTQLLKDAFETPYNTQPNILRNYGNPSVAQSYLPAEGLTPRIRLKAFVESTLDSMQTFWRAGTRFVSYTWPASDTDTDEVLIRIQVSLTDLGSTSYDKTLTWDVATMRATVT